MLKVIATTQFKKDLRKAKRMGKDIGKLAKVVNMIANEEPLDVSFRDHRLKGVYSKFRECHVEPDWLLMYEIKNEMLVLSLARIGTHSELFE